jgi:hypothetical protein
VIIGGSSAKLPLAKRVAKVAFGSAALIVSIVAAITAFSSSSPPALNANYKCVPGTSIPQLKPGESATLRTSRGGFTAAFRSTMPAKAPASGLDFGMPFKGVLKMSRDGQSWTLPRPAFTNDSQINAMCVIGFQREQYPSVMIEGFTGGAHCCEVPVIYLYNKTYNRYDKVVDMSSKHPKVTYVFDDNEGFIPEVVGKNVLLATGDDSFSYAFGCYACSATPLALYAVSPSGLTDVTFRHPALVAAHARTLLERALAAVKAENAVVSTIPAPFGLLAPWVADEREIGRGSSAFSTIERLVYQGKLSNALYYKATLNHGSFILDLRSFLLSDAYCTGQI